jgi:hypothetical protein
MRTRKFGILAVGVLVVSGCGGGATFANKPRPAIPVNLSVYIDNARVSVSPSFVGAGPISFVVTNQASQTESMMIQSPGGSQTLASTGPINPQATAQVTVDFMDPGNYTVSTGKQGRTEAAQTIPSSIRPATIRIGPPRPSASNSLLQP